MKAPDLLNQAADTLTQRGKDYDKPKGERSMEATVHAFNAITGRDLREDEGWLLMECLKNVRLYTNPTAYHRDSAIDGIAYTSLKVESWDEKFAKELLEMRELTTHAPTTTPSPSRSVPPIPVGEIGLTPED